MTHIEFIVATLKRDVEMVKMTLADLSDAEMLVRPVPGANHAAWQVGHLVVAESRLVSAAVPGAVPPPPQGYPDKFNKETAGKDDPTFFPKKAELLENLTKAREATIAWAQNLKPADLDKPIPPPTDRFAPTVGQLLHMLPLHVGMHLGQFQVLRRKLGRPVLF
jgi:DinB family protein